MNERIRQLKQQAKDFYLLQEDLDCSVKQLHELVEAKFADSIIWECMKICEDVMKKDNSALACWSEIKRTFRS